MKWYATKIIFRIISSENTSGQFDEQLRLICANDQNEAFEKALSLAEREDELILGSNVYWNFIGVRSVVELDEIPDGILLNSATIETDSPENYEAFIRNSQVNFEQKVALLKLAVA